MHCLEKFHTLVLLLHKLPHRPFAAIVTDYLYNVGAFCQRGYVHRFIIDTFYELKRLLQHCFACRVGNHHLYLLRLGCFQHHIQQLIVGLGYSDVNTNSVIGSPFIKTMLL